jgi:hypothetical protein
MGDAFGFDGDFYAMAGERSLLWLKQIAIAVPF